MDGRGSSDGCSWGKGHSGWLSRREYTRRVNLLDLGFSLPKRREGGIAMAGAEVIVISAMELVGNIPLLHIENKWD